MKGRAIANAQRKLLKLVKRGARNRHVVRLTNKLVRLQSAQEPKLQ